MRSSKEPFRLDGLASKRSNSESTPYEKAAARVPPPENARPISRSSPFDEIIRPSSTGAATSAAARGMLIGSLRMAEIVAQLPRKVAHNAAPAKRVKCDAKRVDNALATHLISP